MFAFYFRSQTILIVCFYILFDTGPYLMVIAPTASESAVSTTATATPGE